MSQEVMIAGALFSDVPSIRVPDSNGNFHPFTDVSDTTAAAADVATGKYFYAADGTRTAGTSSGGGGGFEPVLTQSIGHIESQSTTEADTGQTASGTTDDYGVFLVVAMCDTPVNGRHLATVSMFAVCSGSSSILGTTVNYYLDSSGNVKGVPYNNTVQYGVYAKISSAGMSTFNLKFYARYNSTRTKAINGDYTVRVYQFKQSDILGG